MKSIKLQDDLFLVGYSKENKNIVMASFAAHLAMGNTILCKAIRSKTIEQYLLAVISLYRTHGYENPMLDSRKKMGRKAKSARAFDLAYDRVYPKVKY